MSISRRFCMPVLVTGALAASVLAAPAATAASGAPRTPAAAVSARADLAESLVRNGDFEQGRVGWSAVGRASFGVSADGVDDRSAAEPSRRAGRGPAALRGTTTVLDQVAAGARPAGAAFVRATRV